MLLTYFFKNVDSLLHRSNYQVVLFVFIVLRLYFATVSWPFGCLRSFVILVILLLYFSQLLFSNCTAFVVSRGDYWLSTYKVFASDLRKLKISSFIQIGMLRSLSNGSCCQSFFIPKLWIKRKIEEKSKLVTYQHCESSSYDLPFPFK